MTEKHKPESTTNDSAAGNPQLAKAMEEYLAELESGIQPNRERFLTLYPDIAVELAACLEGLDFIHCVAPQLKDAERGQSQAPERIHPLATVGDFRIVRELGRGGMGVVYEAEQLSLGRTVALKVLPFAAMLDERQLKRFQNEARVMASLDHPHIVSVHGFGVDRCVHYYAMRLIEGQSLDHVLRDLQRRAAREKLSTETTGSLADAEPTHSNPRPHNVSDDFLSHTEVHDRVNIPYETVGPLDSGGRTEYDSPSIHAARRDSDAKISTQISPDDIGYYRYVARIGMQAAEALGYAHDNGVLHRDIKPGNLLIDSRGWLWVSDFGLAQIKSDLRLTGIGDVVGTLRYMSPEQLMGKTLLVDQRSDIYSLGATLYELATLRPVFDASDRRELLRQVGLEETPTPRQINKRIPVALSTIINKCIQKDPADRYAIAQDVADDLGRFLQDQPIKARPPRLPEKAARWLRHHRSLAWTAAAVLAVFSCGLAISTVLITSERAEAIRQRDEARAQEAIVLAREESLRLYLYAADMKLAWQAWLTAWNEFDLDAIRRLLTRHEPTSDQKDQRSFAWYYLKGLCGQTPRSILTGHAGRVYHLAISPNGKTLATASQDKSAKLWDLASGQVLHTLIGHEGEVNCVAFAPDCQTLATASDDRTVKLWDTLSGQEKTIQALPQLSFPVHRVEFSSDGKLLVTGELSLQTHAAVTATIWDLSTGQQRVRLDGHFPLAFSPDCSKFATTSWDKAVRIWSATDFQELFVLHGQTGLVHTGMFSPDSQTLVTGSEDGILRSWDVSNGQLVSDINRWKREPHAKLWRPHLTRSVAWSPDNKLIAAGDEDGGLTLWEPSFGHITAILRGNRARVWSIKFTPDGKTLASANEDGTVKLWDVIQISRESPPEQQGPIFSISFSPNSELLATIEGFQSARIWNVRTGDPQALTLNDWEEGVLSLAYSPSSSVLAMATSDGSVYFVDLVKGDKRLVIVCSGVSFVGLMFSPDGETLVGDFHDGVRVWDTTSGRELHSLKLPGQDADFRRIAFSPDGKTLAVATVSVVKRLDLASGLVRDLETGHLGYVHCLVYSPDGQTLATGSGDRRIKLWDTRTDQEVVNLVGHSNNVFCLDFSPDGRTLASGSNDGELKLWDVATMQELLSLVGHTGYIRCVAFSPDGETLASAGATADGSRGEIKFWRTAPRTKH